jgi:hypothetical protein
VSLSLARAVGGRWLTLEKGDGWLGRGWGRGYRDLGDLERFVREEQVMELWVFSALILSFSFCVRFGVRWLAPHAVPPPAHMH